MGGFLKYLVGVIPWQYGENLDEIPNAASIPSLCFFFKLYSLTEAIVFEFGFMEFIHCWLIDRENYDN